MVENPRGKLRHWKPFVDWLERRRASRWCARYGNWGHSFDKPTDFWSNKPFYYWDDETSKLEEREDEPNPT